jgi:UDP-N-acetylmuramate--alanine ligase
MYKKNKHIHFVGIGGIGMSGIAELLLNLGYKISGSDLRDTDITKRLAELGGEIYKGHHGEWVTGADVVVISSAVKENNPEVMAAREKFIPVIPRAEMLAELMRLKRFGIAVAGSHGKTSTTSLIGWVMAQAGLDPTVVIGGKVNSLGCNAKLGEGNFLVAEADESDGSFLHLSPVIEVVTNIDLEHLDFYKNIDEIKEVFLQFIKKIPFYGAVVLCLDDPHIIELLPDIQKRVITYGMTSQADISAREVHMEGLVSHFEVYSGRDILGKIALPLVGVHNIQNCLATVAACLELDIPFEKIVSGLETFSGVQRRMEIKGEREGILVVDDYGHHPTEIKATLAAVRSAWPKRRIVVLFQPHRYTRTQGLLKEFCTAFFEADLLFVTEIYSAGENKIEGVNANALVECIRMHGHRHVDLAPGVEQIAEHLMPMLEENDLVLTLGAGNIVSAGEDLLEKLRP